MKSNHLKRREFIALLGGATVWPLTARAQQPARRIGMLIGYAESDPEIQARLAAFRQALAGKGRKGAASVSITASHRQVPIRLRSSLRNWSPCNPTCWSAIRLPLQPRF